MVERSSKSSILTLISSNFPFLVLKCHITLSVYHHSVSSMGFLCRKLLHLSHHHESPTPSPHQSTVKLPLPLPIPSFPHKPSPEIHHILQIALIFIACMVGIFMLLCTVSIALRNYYSRRHNRTRRNTPILFDVNGDAPNDDEDEVEQATQQYHPIWYIRTVGLQQTLIDSITVFKYRKDEGLIEGTECSVCLGEFQQDESLRLLPKCSHAFHIPCIDTWLRSHKNCPLCRAPVVNDGNNSVTVTDQRDSDVAGETQNQVAQIENFDGVAVAVAVAGEFESTGNDDGDDDSGISSSEIPGKILWPVGRSVSMDSSSSASVIFGDVVESSLGSETQFGDKINLSRKDVSGTIGKHGSGKFKRALQKRSVSMRRSFSHNRNFLFSRHCRSRSSTLPL